VRLCVCVLVGVILLGGCDSGEDPKPTSRFGVEDRFARQLAGRVLAGTEPVAGALVHVDPAPGYAADETLAERVGDAGVQFGRTTPTNAAGEYRLQFAPFVYDLSVRHERELVVFRGVAVRFFNASLPVEAPVSGFTATVVPTTDPPTKAGNAVAYFVSGADARTIGADAGPSAPGAREVRFRQFDSTITLHAVEYVAARGPAAAVAEGRLDVRVHQGTVVTPIVPMTLVADTAKVTKFDAPPPAGFTLAPFDVEMDLGLRTSAVRVASVEPGAPLEIALVKDARYAVRARATQGSAVSESGRMFFNPADAKVTCVLPGPVSFDVSEPTTLETGGVLAATIDRGAVEHVLVPESGAGTIVHVVTSSRATTLPDVSAFGLPRPTGRYLWSLQHFPKVPHIDNLSGEDGRVVQPSFRSSARVIELR
jgi:hypothetical protein